MEGFTFDFEGGVCPVALFWALSSKSSYVLALSLTFLGGILHEALSFMRRCFASGGSAGTREVNTAVAKLRMVDTTLHAAQLTLGYCLMLLTMTYHLQVRSPLLDPTKPR